MTKTFFDDVGEFHEKFGLATVNTVAPRALDRSALLFRLGFMLEELAEFCTATGLHAVASDLTAVKENLPYNESPSFELRTTELCSVGDALGDLTYVALGTAQLMGLPFNEMWAEIQRANLSKERATGADDPRSKRGHALDVVKPIGFRPPDHSNLIVAAFERKMTR